MATDSQDQELMTAFAGDSSEAAFRALVRRHVDLVYATAFRQIGDRGFAEEITQNVFVSLARKAPRLTGLKTLAGWLHRTTVLESKAWIRAELRRRNRESVAGQLAELRAQGSEVLEALVPLLDEALLHLRESDRLVLILRFMEERSLREVGESLGVDEDAARKRVSRALERVAHFFRQRGFALPGGAIVGFTALATQGTQVASSELAISASAVGLAATSGAITGFTTLTVQFMAHSKTPTAVFCALMVAAPLAWQWRARSAADAAVIASAERLTVERRSLNQRDEESARLRMSLLRADAEGLATRNRLAEVTGPSGAAAPKGYHWNDASPVMRMPKSVLKRLSVTTVGDKRGRLTPQIKEVLQLTSSEIEGIEAAIGRFLEGCHSAEAAVVRRVEPDGNDLNGHTPETTRVFELPDLKSEVARLRGVLFEELGQLLDQERSEMVIKGLQTWMPVDESDQNLNSSLAVFNAAHRLRFYKTPEQQSKAPRLDWGVTMPGIGTMNLPILVDEIPEYLRLPLKDWIDDARKAFAEVQKAKTSKP